MPFTLKNLSGFPLDVATVAGPVVLPAYGEVIAELGALDEEVMRQSPYVEVAEGKKKADPLDHDANGKKGGSKAPEGDAEETARLRSEYQDLFGKRPFNGWDAEELQRRIDEKLGE